MSRVLHPYINITGIRSGEYIEGPSHQKQSRGIVLQVEGLYPYYPPYFSDFASSPSLNELYNLRPFTGLDPTTIMDKIRSSGSSNNTEYYLNDVDVRIRLVASSYTPSRDKSSAYTIELLRILSDDQFHSIKEVYEAIRPEGKKGRFSLLFRPTNWILSNYESPQLLNLICNRFNPEAWVVNLISNQISYTTPSNPYIMTKSGIVIAYQAIEVREQWLIDLKNAVEVDPNLINQLKWMSPGLLKSLLQKIIRTRALTVEIDGQAYPGEQVLTATIITLITHPGVYNPRIHRFVSGVESLSKRLAVSIYEDSYSDSIHLSTMLAVALLVQQVRDYYPPIALVQSWIEVARQAHLDPRFFNYSIQPISVSDLAGISNVHIFNHRLLDEIGSFQTDINMVGWIAHQPSYSTNSELQPLAVMPIYHAIDQHNYPEFIYFFSPVSRFFTPTTNSTRDTISSVWNLSSKFNTRKTNWINNPSIKAAQRKYWEQLRPHTFNELVTGSPVSYQVTINTTTIAGCIGHLDLGDCYGILVPSDLNTKLIIRKPTRDSKIIRDFTPVEYQQRLNSLDSLLTRGITITRVPNGLEVLKGSVVRLVNQRLMLEVHGVSLFLDQEMQYAYQLYHHQVDPDTLTDDQVISLSAEFRPLSVLNEYQQKILNHLAKYSRPIHKRLLIYLDSKSTITLNKLTRLGEGEDYQPSMLDVQINIILSYWSVIMPGVFRRRSPVSFEVMIEPLYHQVVKAVRVFTANRTTMTQLTSPTIYPEIQLYPHQQSATQQLLERISLGYNKNIIWMTPGLGKTLISIYTILNLLAEGTEGTECERSASKCPRYVIYTLPQSASATVISQYQGYFPVQLLTNISQIRSDCVNFVYHDTIKNWQLGDILDDSLVIIDEFHLGMGDTLRSRYLIELASYASMSIMMTGTLIRYGDPNYIIKWLNLISDFYLDSHNYWVSITGVISWLLQTNVRVEIEDIEVMGIEIPNLPFHQLLTETYRSITPVMVAKTLEVISDSRSVSETRSENVFIVAWNSQHQQEIRSLLLTRLRPEQIGLITSTSTLDLTYYDQSPIRVVITTIRQEAGYSLTKMGVMITGIYPSNQATREQLMYRINRIGQHREAITIYRYHGGVTTLLLSGYDKTMTVNEMLKTLANKISVVNDDEGEVTYDQRE